MYMRIKSKIDWWLGGLIWTIVVILAAAFMMTPKEGRIVAIAVMLPILLFLIWMYFGTYYELRDTYLYCRSGILMAKIPYERIKSVKLSQNLFSSFALARKRIEIREHGKGFIMGTTYISPPNREEFLRELTIRCKNLER
jgi:uncharacterized membrane protein YdbT with pleckstrin-like domain